MKIVIKIFGKRLTALLSICLLPFLFSGQLVPRASVYVTEGQIEPIPVAIADFTGLMVCPLMSDGKLPRLYRMVSSGLFLSIDSAAFIVHLLRLMWPNFADWTPLGAKGLLIGSAFLDNDGLANRICAMGCYFAAFHHRRGGRLIRQACAALPIK